MQKIHDLRLSLEEAESDYLKRKGWESTCRVPGCYWLWSREMPASGVAGVNWLLGRILCDTKTALLLQESIDAWLSTKANVRHGKGPL